MKPLDLTKYPPRGPREKLDGLLFMPRTIDKIRASLDGGNLGPYFVKTGMSKQLLDIIGVAFDDLQAAVAAAKDDAEVARWLREHADTAKYEAANHALSNATGDDVPPAHRAFFESLYPEHLRNRHRLNFDLVEADDAELFPSP